MFPPAKSLIAPASQVWSHDSAASLQAPMTYYPAGNLIDGQSSVVARSQYGTDNAIIDLGLPRTPNIFGVIGHNIQYNLVCGFRASASVGMGSLLLDRGAAARKPNFWLDLRGFPATAQFWQFYVNANPRPISLGEIVIATGFEFDGDIIGEIEENIVFPQERAELEYGQIALSASGSLVRQMQLRLSLTDTDKAHLYQISAEAGDATGIPRPVIVVPSTHRNDIWYVEWPEIYEEDFTVGETDKIEVTLTLREEAVGAI